MNDMIMPGHRCNLFGLKTIVAIFSSILRAEPHDQSGIASKLMLLKPAKLCFYLGTSGVLEQVIVWGWYSGLYALLALVSGMARRVLYSFDVS